MDNAYTMDTFKDRILRKQPAMKDKLELLEKTLYVQTQPDARKSALADFLKREVVLRQEADLTLFVWRKPDGDECTLELGQDDDFDFFGSDDVALPDAPAIQTTTQTAKISVLEPVEAATPPVEAAEPQSETTETTDDEDAEEEDTQDEDTQEGEDEEEDTNEPEDENNEPDDSEADAEEIAAPGNSVSKALFATLAASLGKGATAVLTVAKDGDNLVVTYSPHSAGDAAEHDRPFSVTASAAELDHPTEGLTTLIGTTTQVRKTLKEAKAEYEAAAKAEVDARKAEIEAKKKAADAKKNATKTEAKTTPEKAKTDKEEVTPKPQEASLFG